MSLLKTIISALDDLKAEDIEILDMEQNSPLFDHMVICSATNERQLKAIVDHVVKEVETKGFTVKHVEGKNGNLWVLIDCIDAVVHVFNKEEREKYNLEKLWGEAKRLKAIDYID